ncbi:MAG: glycosyltransferase [Planctomycetes bacterium]|nr:glycosyltransferase [Planctomycetota bacterium]
MKILLVHPHDVYSKNEPWTVRVIYLANEFLKAGHEVKVAYHIEDPNLTPQEASARQEHPFETIPLVRYSRTLVRKNKEMKRVASWADIISFQKCFAWASLPSIHAASKLKIPVHYDWDDWEYEIYRTQPIERQDEYMALYIHELEGKLLTMVDSVSVASESLRGMAMASGVRKDRICLAPVGADTERFNPDVSGEKIREQFAIDRPTVIYMGQLHDAQYCDQYLEMAKAIVDEGRVVPYFLIVGGGSRLDDLKRKAIALGLREHTIFTGPVPHEKIPEYIAAADVAVACFASTDQTRTKSPLKVAEYLAMGKAIVATNMGEVPRMTQDAAVLVAPGDIQGLAYRTTEFLLNENLRKDYQRRARRQSEKNLTWRHTAENMLALFTEDVAEYDRIYPGLKKKIRARESAVAEIGVTEIKPGPVLKLKGFLKRNRDLMGAFASDGKVFVGPRIVQVEPTNLCNNDCVACWCNSPLLEDLMIPVIEKKATIPYEVLKRLFAELSAIGCREIYFAGGGDPTMHPRIMDILAEVKRQQMIGYLNTNLLRLSDANLEQMVDMEFDHITLSAWAGSPEAYSRTHPNKDHSAFYRMREQMLLLRDLKAKRKAKRKKISTGYVQNAPRIKVYHVISNLNFEDVDNMFELQLETGAEWIEFAPIDTMPDKTDYLLLDKEQREWLHARCLHWQEELTKRGKSDVLYNWDTWMRRLSTEEASVGGHDAGYIHTLPCTVGYSFARVVPSGEVHSCLKSHRIPLGNIYDSSFTELWTSPFQNEFRKRTNVFEKNDASFFSLIGNDPTVCCGCEKSCDDVGRNEYLWNRWQEMPWWKKQVLKAGAKYLEASGKAMNGEKAFPPPGIGLESLSPEAQMQAYQNARKKQMKKAAEKRDVVVAK